ncbi:MAG: DUF2934 domain-containing protein [Bryobacteraceae bacterium]
MGHSWGRLHASRTQPLAPPAEEARRPRHEEIARLAYSYWEARGRQDGGAREDWLRAEGELRESDSR